MVQGEEAGEVKRAVDAAPHDYEVVRRQIGREPRGMIGVSRRCRFGCPQVVVTEPLYYSDPSSTPLLFPTTYWLSCPHLCRSVSTLESRALIGAFRKRVQADPDFAARLKARHEQYAKDRVSMVDANELERLEASHPNIHGRLVKLGIGGIEDFRGVKCLHLHLADYLSGGNNPVGEEVSLILAKEGTPLECETGLCAPCGANVAVINVGSNSVKLLIAQAGRSTKGDGCLKEVLKRVIVTRLAEGMIGGNEGQRSECRLKKEAISRAAEAVEKLVAKAQEHKPSTLTVFGTAAVRQAENRSELIAAIRDRTGVELSVIDEQEEAELSYRAAVTVLQHLPDTHFALVADIGGGSTEITLGRGRTVVKSVSVELGALTALPLAGVELDDAGRLPPALLSELRQRTTRAFDVSAGDLLTKTPEIAVAGGSVTALAALMLGLDRMDPGAAHGFRITYDSAVALLDDLCARSRHERLEMRGMLESERVDSIVAGCAILVSLMDIARAGHIVVSEYGVLEGMAYLELTCSSRL